MKTRAIRIHEHGGPEVLKFESVDLPEPGEGEARVRHTAIGLNFIDTYHRSGLYPLPALPSGIGMEAAGVIEAVGADEVALPPLYFAHQREVFERDGMWLTAGEWGGPKKGEEIEI